MINRLRTRAEIRRKLIHQQVRKEPDRIAALLEEAATALEQAQALAKECYEEAYAFELEYPSTHWSRLLFRVGKLFVPIVVLGLIGTV